MNLNQSSKLRFWSRVEIAGWLFVILGCIGEGLGEFAEWPEDKNLSHKIGTVSWLVLVSGLALEWLGGRREGAIKDLHVAESYRLAAVANERAEQLGKEAEDARLELEKIREKYRKRIITQEQAQAFLAGTTEAPKEGLVCFLAYSAEGSATFAESLRSLLSKAGYLTSDTVKGCIRFEGPKPCDVEILVKDILNPPPFLAVLAEALRGALALEVVTGTIEPRIIRGKPEEIFPNDARLTVYPKPLLE